MPATLRANQTAAQLKARWHAEVVSGMNDIGKYVQAQAAKYPAQNPATSYRRTGTLGRSITASKVDRSGQMYRMTVGTNKAYARYVEEGTGIYGPKGAPITPKSAKALAWRSTRGRLGGRRGKMIASGMRRSKGKFKPSPKHDTMMVFAMSSRGMPGWFFMKKAFTDARTVSYFKARVERIVKDFVGS